MTRRLVLLPGLDGTGALFEPFLRATPPGVRAEPIALPAEPLGYAELAERLVRRVRPDESTVLVAESFAGPLAATLAARHHVAGVVLCNSFVTPPGPERLGIVVRALGALVAPVMFRVAPPRALVRRYLVGPEAPEALVAAVRRAVASVPPAVLAARLRAVLRADAGAELARSGAPVMYLRGTDDRVVTESSVRAVVRAAVGVRVVRVPGPHLLLQARPESAWRAIEGWVAGLSEAR